MKQNVSMIGAGMTGSANAVWACALGQPLERPESIYGVGVIAVTVFNQLNTR